MSAIPAAQLSSYPTTQWHPAAINVPKMNCQAGLVLVPFVSSLGEALTAGVLKEDPGLILE